MPYTKEQEEVIKKYAVRLYEVGFLQDTTLEDSSCACCGNKRQLMREVKKALEDKNVLPT